MAVSLHLAAPSILLCKHPQASLITQVRRDMAVKLLNRMLRAGVSPTVEKGGSAGIPLDQTGLTGAHRLPYVLHLGMKRFLYRLAACDAVVRARESRTFMVGARGAVPREEQGHLWSQVGCPGAQMGAEGRTPRVI